MLDDSPNILTNPPLHITNLMPETLWQTFFAKPFDYGHLYRPIPCFTFALNWFFGGDHPFGYHLINILIHILTSLTLFATTRLLFKTPVLASKYSDYQVTVIALVSTLLWALHPIQISAVTYIVQRMTSMAALFFLGALFFYLRFKLVEKKRVYIFLTIFCYISAVLSKENTVILPFSILLIELIFFTTPNRTYSKKYIFIMCTISCAVFFYAIWYFFDHNYYKYIFEPIGSRPFSLFERFISQPQIVLFYLSLILFPLHNRFSVDHDTTIYHSLFEPMVILSFTAIFLLILLSIYYRKKYPLISFSILFYFVNHLIESTIIPLELIFEHRNYLPTLFFFVPFAAVTGKQSSDQDTSSPFRPVYLISALAIILTFGWNTYQRNKVWESELTLWHDAYIKAPDNARPAAKLGELYGWNPEKTQDNFNKSMFYLNKALTGHAPRLSYQHAIIGNMGEVCFLYGQYGLSEKYYRQALDRNPSFTNHLYGLTKVLTVQGKFSEALTTANNGIIQDSEQIRFHQIKGLLLLWLDRPDDATDAFREALSRTQNKRQYFYNLGVALSKSGYHDRAEWFLRFSTQVDLKRLLFSLLENSLLAQDNDKNILYSNLLRKKYSESQLTNDLHLLKNDYRNVPLNTELLIHFFSDNSQKI